jgi:hypothetical protein
LLSDGDVARVLMDVKGTPPAEARALAAIAGGSVARALAEASGEAAEDREAALALLTIAAAGRGVMDRLKAAAQLAAHETARRAREALGARLVILGSLLRDVAALTCGDRAAITHVDLAADLDRVAPAFDRRRLLEAWAAIGRATDALDRNGSPKIVADWISVRL